MSGEQITPKIHERFFSNIVSNRLPDECWEWGKARNQDGYGIFSVAGKLIRAHRASWLIFHGEIPPGLLVCHKCDNPSCVNPNHLFVGTMQDNMDDAVRKGKFVISKTHCVRGHLYSGANVGVRSDGARFCRTCRRDRDRNRKFAAYHAAQATLSQPDPETLSQIKEIEHEPT